MRDPSPIWSYWNRLQAATQEPTLHRACNLPYHISEAAAHVHKRNRNATIGQPSKGSFFLFRGDSHMRATWVAFLRSVTREREALKNVGVFDIHNYHHDHLFCCSMDSSSSFSSCHMHVGHEGGNLTSFKSLVKQYVVDQGEMCAGFRFNMFFRKGNADPAPDSSSKESDGSLGTWLEEPNGIAPDLYLANGGSHYTTTHVDDGIFAREFETWMAAAEKSLALDSARSVSYVLTSSPHNSWFDWDRQRGIFETMRTSVINLQQSAKDHASYIDFHSMIGADNCGFSTKIPNKAYTITVKIICHSHSSFV